MSEEVTVANSGARVKAWSVFWGVAFMVLWGVGHVIWATMALMGTAMANDSGAASSEAHVSLIGGVLGGQVVAGLAGIPGGLAFFWRGARKVLWVLFGVLFVSGAVWQTLAFKSFVTATHLP